MNEITVGSRWRDNDPRGNRIVEVISVDNDLVTIKAVDTNRTAKTAASLFNNSGRSGFRFASQQACRELLHYRVDPEACGKPAKFTVTQHGDSWPTCGLHARKYRKRSDTRLRPLQ